MDSASVGDGQEKTKEANHKYEQVKMEECLLRSAPV